MLHVACCVLRVVCVVCVVCVLCAVCAVCAVCVLCVLCVLCVCAVCAVRAVCAVFRSHDARSHFNFKLIRLDRLPRCVHHGRAGLFWLRRQPPHEKLHTLL